MGGHKFESKVGKRERKEFINQSHYGIYTYTFSPTWKVPNRTMSIFTTQHIHKYKKESLQRVEARTGSLKGIQRNCLSSQDQVRKAKVLTELNLTSDVKSNKKRFCRYVSDKRKARKKCGPSLEGNRRPG